ncbi:MAG: hypothetical protein KDN05_24270, partial [Verrucomicrobiae bacterium]|nr:hypothetical protein [Verrucomicrobiae bacterium]
TDEPVIGYSDAVSDGPLPFEQTITRTWTATDDAGNSSQGVQKITLQSFGPSFSLTDVVGRPTYGLFSPATGAGKRQLGRITSEGAVSLLGTDASLDAGDISTGAGITAFDRQTQTVFAVGTTASDGLSRIFSINGHDGSSTSVVLSTGTTGTVVGIWWDEGSSTLHGVLQTGVGSVERQLVAIDPATGVVSFIGSSEAGILSTVAGTLTGSAGAGEIYFLGSPGGLPGSVYTVNLATGVMTGAALVGANFNAISGMEFSEVQGKLYALVFVGAERQLAEVDPTTGVVTLLGSGTVGGGGVAIATYSGVNTIDEFSGTFLFVGRYNNGVSNAWAIWGVDVLTGDSSFSEIDTSSITDNGYHGLEYGRLRKDALTITGTGFAGADF